MYSEVDWVIDTIVLILPYPLSVNFFIFPMENPSVCLPLDFGFSHVACIDEWNLIRLESVSLPNLSLKKPLCLHLPSHTSVIIMRRIWPAIPVMTIWDLESHSWAKSRSSELSQAVSRCKRRMFFLSLTFSGFFM